MANDTLTFVFGGAVDIRTFRRVIDLFSRLADALSDGTDVKWLIDDLAPGSATTILPRSKVSSVITMPWEAPWNVERRPTTAAKL